MLVELLAGCSWNAWPSGVEYAVGLPAFRPNGGSGLFAQCLIYARDDYGSTSPGKHLSCRASDPRRSTRNDGTFIPKRHIPPLLTLTLQI